ncbi:phenoloxidase-activating factor 2-like [Venturia canescens]|uniref:phenoloxidase-activating factor 2-like n=1 Tax=Venturia canescens TaxID=32260 RepID=UPI001C9CAB0F|nr:phenoloxidase-activating factor 2-like [Venturia canescens]
MWRLSLLSWLLIASCFAAPQLSSSRTNNTTVPTETEASLSTTVTPSNTTRPPLRRDSCGRRNLQGLDASPAPDGAANRAKYGEFPWMVAVCSMEEAKTDEVHTVYMCGGALIHPRAVLTAAHRVVGKNINKLKIITGDWDASNLRENLSHQEQNVAKVIIHEQFNPGSLANDFALLILAHPLNLTEAVDVVCLPKSEDRFDFTRCLATGWGKDVYGGQYQKKLKKIELPVIPHSDCQTALRTRLSPNFVLNPSFICAGGEAGRDTCTGDGGSPLVCPLKNHTNRYAQAGIVAWGVECARSAVPAVYANVASVRSWIDAKMEANRLETFVYSY